MSYKIGEVIEYLRPEIRPVIAEMVKEAGANGEMTVEQLLGIYTPDNPSMNRDRKMALLAIAFVRSNKFSSKLSFDERCQVLALHRWGLTREAIAKMYGIDRRTVTHIHTASSPHYKNVRQREVDLGPQHFMDTYLNEELMTRGLAYRQIKEAAPEGNNKYANRKAGIHMVRGKMCEKEHRVMIAWREQDDIIELAGWYYRDLDGDYPENWFCVGDDSRKTSNACYVAMLGDITDRMT